MRHPLTGNQPVKAILRIILWQIQSRMTKKPIKKAFIGNTSLWMQRGWTGVTGNLYAGLHEYEDMAFLLHFLRERDTFADVGANMGSYTVLAAGVCKSKTVSIEPVPATFHRLMANIQLNHLESLVTAINAAAGEHQGIISFTHNQDTTNHVSNDSREETIKVPVATLDSMLPDCPALIKIDVEGYETAVLNGAHKLLQNPDLKAIIIELNGSGMRYGFDELAIHQKLLDSGFQSFHYSPDTRSLEHIPIFGTHNTIYCRDIGFVSERLRSANPFIVLNRSI